MSKMKDVLKKSIKTLAQVTAQSSVNSACALFIYQPKVPEGLESFVKRGKKEDGSGESE